MQDKSNERFAEDVVLIMDRALKHGLSEEQVRRAWDNHIDTVLRIERDDGYVDYKTIGFSDEGHVIELTARLKPFGFLIYHANTPPTARAYKELGLRRR